MKSNEFIEKNPELFKKAQKCKSLDEFLKLAKDNNIEFEDISLEEAYNFLNNKQEINDDLLDNVDGGKGQKYTKITCEAQRKALDLMGVEYIKKYNDYYYENQ